LCRYPSKPSIVDERGMSLEVLPSLTAGSGITEQKEMCVFSPVVKKNATEPMGTVNYMSDFESSISNYDIQAFKTSFVCGSYNFFTTTITFLCTTSSSNFPVLVEIPSCCSDVSL
jgi:hypothetical protein